jgi:Fe2+ or Zn2+ uptake regulation protein
MSEYQRAIRVLRANGYKVTGPRKQVFRVLDGAQEPVSPYEIQKMLEAGGEHLNHVTIYRILDLFCNLNLAHKVLLLNGFVKCSLGEKDGCHRFMVCRECGAFREFADESLCNEEREIARELGFFTEQHLAESVGLCLNCRKDKHE